MSDVLTVSNIQANVCWKDVCYEEKLIMSPTGSIFLKVVKDFDPEWFLPKKP